MKLLEGFCVILLFNVMIGLAFVGAWAIGLLVWGLKPVPPPGGFETICELWGMIAFAFRYWGGEW